MSTISDFDLCGWLLNTAVQCDICSVRICGNEEHYPSLNVQSYMSYIREYVLGRILIHH